MWPKLNASGGPLGVSFIAFSSSSSPLFHDPFSFLYPSFYWCSYFIAPFFLKSEIPTSFFVFSFVLISSSGYFILRILFRSYFGYVGTLGGAFAFLFWLRSHPCAFLFSCQNTNSVFFFRVLNLKCSLLLIIVITHARAWEGHVKNKSKIKVPRDMITWK